MRMRQQSQFSKLPVTVAISELVVSAHVVRSIAAISAADVDGFVRVVLAAEFGGGGLEFPAVFIVFGV